jgi:thymidine kinase
MAKLYFRYGAMNSGKSTAVLQVAHNYEERGMRVIIVKPAIDTKANDKISSRIGVERTVDVLLKPAESLVEATGNKLMAADCIITDEAQFFTKEQIDELFEIAVHRNIPVICYGIRTDFRRNLFSGSKRLFELAHSLEELKTICRCGKKALFNARKINDKFVFEGSQVAIDGKDKVSYESLCGQCYFEEHQSANGN